MSQSAIEKSISDEGGMELMEIQKRALVEFFSGESSDIDIRQVIDSDLIKFITLYRSDRFLVTDERVKLWLFKIAPTCVNKIKDSYACHCCRRKFKSSSVLIRHYRELHYEDLPERIFGEQFPYSCESCNMKFKRVEHYNNHMQSMEHAKKSNLEYNNSSSEEEEEESKEYATRATLKRRIENEDKSPVKKSKQEKVTFSQAIEVLNESSDTSLEFLSSSDTLSESMTSTPIKQEENSVRFVDTEDEEDQLLIKALIEYESRQKQMEQLSQTLSQSSL